MSNQELELFKKNYNCDKESLPLLDKLLKTYGKGFLSTHLLGWEDLHTVEIMEEIKSEMENKFIVSICATSQIVEEELGIDRIFPNIDLLLDYDTVIEMMIKKEWLDEYVIMKPKIGLYTSRERTIYTKGCNWNKCHPKIQEHFLIVKSTAIKNF